MLNVHDSYRCHFSWNVVNVTLRQIHILHYCWYHNQCVVCHCMEILKNLFRLASTKLSHLLMLWMKSMTTVCLSVL